MDTINSYAPFNTDSLTSDNTIEQFYVRPIDPCHNAVLYPWPVDNIVYILTDTATYLTTNSTQDSITLNSMYNTAGYSLGYGLCGNNNYTILNSAF